MKRPPNRRERKRRAIQRARSANRVRANRERLARLHRRFAEAMRPAQELWAKLFAEPRVEKLIGTLRGDGSFWMDQASSPVADVTHPASVFSALARCRAAGEYPR